MIMDSDSLTEMLDHLCERYNNPEFIAADPIAVAHRYSKREDIEISGLLAATLAWGNRRAIVANATRLVERMDDAPYDFVMNASTDELNGLIGFVHRTFNAADAIDFVLCLRHLCRRYGSIGQFFENEYASCGDLRRVIAAFRTAFFEAPHRPHCEKHLSAINKGAACKRLCMYLRWMVRHDACGVDFGLWRSIPPSALYIPLDLHTARTARAWGLLSRRSNDWRAVEELTSALRGFDPSDPVRYDYALFGAGIYSAEELSGLIA